MTKQRITVLGIIIISIALGRFLLNRIDQNYTRSENIYTMMYVTDSATVHVEPSDTSEVLYTLFFGDSVLARNYTDSWKELYSGGFLPSALIADDKL
jgi:hypothetical protein